MADDRFSHISKDPRFKNVPVRERKVKIDKRFQSMFKDKKFNYKYSVDKRGRPVQTSTSENLRKYYELSDESENTSEESDDEEIESTLEKTLLEKKSQISHKTVKVSVSKKDKANKSKSKNGCVADDSLAEPCATSTGARAGDSSVVLWRQKRKVSTDVNESERKMKECRLKESSEEEIEENSDGDDSNVDTSDESDDSDVESGLGSGVDLARGIGNGLSSSDDSDFDSQDENYSDPGEIVHDWGELDKNVSLTSELTNRLAVCNMDWDNVKATDLFVIFNSFKPSDGAIVSVKIYPSEFGVKRMEEEKVKGPAELAEIVKNNDSDEDREEHENEEGHSFHNEKLRQYEINRMKYYYAVVGCDSTETADHIYNELDGAEYENSKTCFDIRYIPDEMEFNQEVKDYCTEMPTRDCYTPNQFVNKALCSAKVDLTWDETDKNRIEVTSKKFTKKDDILLDDFKAYLASSSDEDASDTFVIQDLESEEDSDYEEQSDAKMAKYKKLLKTAKEAEKRKKKEENVKMEVTWEPGLKEKTEDIIKQKDKKKNSTPWNEYLEKVKEKQRKKKAARKAAKKEALDEKNLFSDDDIPSDVDLNDPYFSSELKPSTDKKSKIQRKKQMKKQKDEFVDDYSGLTTQEIELKKQEKAELALLMADGDDVGDKKQHFDFENYIESEKGKKMKDSKKKFKKKPKVEDDFKIDLNDERFGAVFVSSLYNIDKSAPEYKKSSGMEALVNEKLRRRYEGQELSAPKRKSHNEDGTRSGNIVGKRLKMEAAAAFVGTEQSLDSLIRSVKAKAESFNKSKKKPNKNQ